MTSSSTQFQADLAKSKARFLERETARLARLRKAYEDNGLITLYDQMVSIMCTSFELGFIEGQARLINELIKKEAANDR